MPSTHLRASESQCCSWVALVFFPIKDAVAAAHVEASMVGPFTLDSPATPERTCLACNTPFTQKIPASKPGSFQP
nr:aldehyde oxidase-like [Salvelinus alpinus]